MQLYRPFGKEPNLRFRCSALTKWLLQNKIGYRTGCSCWASTTDSCIYLIPIAKSLNSCIFRNCFWLGFKVYRHLRSKIPHTKNPSTKYNLTIIYEPDLQLQDIRLQNNNNLQRPAFRKSVWLLDVIYSTDYTNLPWIHFNMIVASNYWNFNFFVWRCLNIKKSIK
jgi:hypothetical protein